MSGTSSFGARAHAGGVRFSVPGPRASACAVRVFEGEHPTTIAMPRNAEGAFELDVPGLRVGARYRYVLDGDELSDPFARLLPEGVEGPASVASLAYQWKHEPLGATARDMPIYELHVGAFTKEGTYRSAGERLAYLADLGVRAIELMPVAAFAGARGWGYDGVAHYAPFAPYGRPEELAAFVDDAHALGLRVVLDVVYNHFGPAGNSLRRFVPEAFTTRFANPWGEAPDFANPVMRAYVLDNVRYWLGEFRFDGLRLDATHAITDDSETHVLRDVARIAHASVPRRFAIAEDERNEPALVREMELDGIWADDFHHGVHVALTGERDGYYRAYSGEASEIARTIERGWLYCGEVYPPSGEPRGRSSEDIEARSLAYCIQNHDQIGNRALGERLSVLTDADGFAAASLLLLLLPATPLLFMGQEWGATAPFQYFTDHEPELGRKVTEGRSKEFAHFQAFGGEGASARVPDPQAAETWLASKLDWSERLAEPHARILNLVRTLLHLRREDAVLRDQARARARLRAWHHGELLVVDRWSGADERRIVTNLTGKAIALDDLAQGWRLLLSTSDTSWPAVVLPKHAAILLGNEGLVR